MTGQRKGIIVNHDECKNGIGGGQIATQRHLSCGQQNHGIVHSDEQRFQARLIDSTRPRETALYQRLRYDYFVCQRGWIPPDLAASGLESDRYDLHCRHLTVSDLSDEAGVEANIAAYLRVLPWQMGSGFMLEYEFSHLLPQAEREHLITSNSVELSRLVVAPHVKAMGASATRQVIELLLKLLYRLSLQEGWDTYYIVVEEAWLTAFTRRYHLPFTRLGVPYTFLDGTRTVAAIAHRNELEAAVQHNDSTKYAWYTEKE